MKVSVDQGLWWKVGCDLVVGLVEGPDRRSSIAGVSGGRMQETGAP